MKVFDLFKVPTDKDKKRFWTKANLTANIKLCWNWTRSKSRTGYGFFSFCDRMIVAHRISYYFYYGVDPKELKVCHSCDNPSCVNPNHLFLGTQADNVLDCAKKGRIVGPGIGELNRESKLKEQEVLEIRNLYSKGGESHRTLGRKFNVSRGLIRSIVKRWTWKHI